MATRNAEGQPEAEPLIGTKLHAPPTRNDLVSRSDLVELLRAGYHRQLTLLSAPAGYGKTTLLAEWRAAEAGNHLFAWLSLDQQDDHMVRFWTYVIAALRTVAPNVGAESLAALKAGADLTRFVLPPLLNELTLLSEEVILVLDDYHHIRQRRNHEGVAFLIDHAPATLHVVISTRAEPLLAIGALRANGQLSEIRSEELNFTAEEASALLNGTMELGLVQGEIEHLWEQTEGWAAGLYLAGLSLRHHTDPHAFVEEFAGDNRHIVDYLGEQVIRSQPEEIATFLRRTSILDRFTGSLCDAVLETGRSNEILRNIERSNLFLVGLDERREWYRYHNLFAELLRVELKNEEPELIPTLHRRASAWYRRSEMPGEAIQHAIAAGDIAEAGELILSNWVSYVNAGQTALITAWLGALPEEAIAGDPPLSLVAAWIAMFAGEEEEAERFLRLAEDGHYTGPLPDGTSSIESGAALIRAFSVFSAAGGSRAREAAQRAVELETDGASPWQAVVHLALGYSLYWSGEYAEARAPLEVAARLGEASEQPLIVVNTLALLSYVEQELRHHVIAEAYARGALEFAEENKLTYAPQVGTAHVALGKVFAGRGKLAQAEGHIERGLALQREVGRHPEIADTLFTLALVRRTRGDAAGTRELLDEARGWVEGSADPGILSSLLERTELTLRRAPRKQIGLSEELSERELDVLRLLTTELSQREIGESLYLSFNTVHAHTRAIYRKLDVSSREQAVERARHHGIL